ncbi:MAG: hypothetical protein FWD68_18105 [Alphaproteobacteria bacterium]|nr:hypothetical protein [Alphaproteobacteria bacterium]
MPAIVRCGHGTYLSNYGALRKVGIDFRQRSRMTRYAGSSRRSRQPTGTLRKAPSRDFADAPQLRASVRERAACAAIYVAEPCLSAARTPVFLL